MKRRKLNKIKIIFWICIIILILYLSRTSNFGIKNTDFYYDSSHLSKDAFVSHLKSNRPILICVWNKPSVNRWTSASHYMALLATDGELVYVSNPNGLNDSSKSSGWYDFNEVLPWTAKALFIENYKKGH